MRLAPIENSSAKHDKLRDAFRIGCGGCFFVVSAALLAIMFLMPLPSHPTTWKTVLLFFVSLGVIVVIAKNFFQKRLSFAEQVKQLEATGLLQLKDYQAKRALQIEAWGDEGSHYFIELSDDTVLYLRGQELYEYEPIEDDPELNQPRRFPCTNFTVRSHKTKKYLVDILCGTEVVEPETLFCILHREDYLALIDLESNSIIHGRTYDQIKKERLDYQGANT